MKNPWKILAGIILAVIVIAGALTIRYFYFPVYNYEPDIVVNSRSYYAEGPLWHGNTLYYVEYSKHRVMKWKGETNTELWHRDGCGPASIIDVSDTKLLVSCYDDNYLAEINLQGTTVRKLSTDTSGKPFTGPNDFAKDSRGGVYFSASGKFDVEAPPEGKVLYISLEGQIQESADGLHYPNGLAVSGKGNELYVNEHLSSRIRHFAITEPGSLTDLGVFSRIAILSDSPYRNEPYSGPDGLKINIRGHLFVCHYGASEILVLDKRGERITSVPVPDRYVTNANFGSSERELFVTTAVDAWNQPYPGKVYRFSINRR